jgi:hypothetical protein
MEKIFTHDAIKTTNNNIRCYVYAQNLRLVHYNDLVIKNKECEVLSIERITENFVNLFIIPEIIKTDHK